MCDIHSKILSSKLFIQDYILQLRRMNLKQIVIKCQRQESTTILVPNYYFLTRFPEHLLFNGTSIKFLKSLKCIPSKVITAFFFSPSDVLTWKKGTFHLLFLLRTYVICILKISLKFNVFNMRIRYHVVF